GLDNEKDKLDDNYETLTDQVEEKQNILDKTQEELDKIDTLKSDYEALILSEVDLTTEKGKGIDAIEEEIQKLKDARDELENNTDESLKNTEQYQQQVEDIGDQIGKLEDAQTELEEVNRLAGETVYDKEIKIEESPTLANFEQKLKRPISKVVNIATRGFDRANSLLRAYADGTDHHPGGAFIAGEEGWELGRMGNRWDILNPGIYDAPSGYEVFTHDESKKIL